MSKRVSRISQAQSLTDSYAQIELSAFGLHWMPPSLVPSSGGFRWTTWREYLEAWLSVRDQWGALFADGDPFSAWLYGSRDPDTTFAERVFRRWGVDGPPADLEWWEILEELGRFSRLPKGGGRP